MTIEETVQYYREEGHQCYQKQNFWLSYSYFQDAYKICDQARDKFDKRTRLAVLDQLCSVLSALVMHPQNEKGPVDKNSDHARQYRQQLEFYCNEITRLFPHAVRAHLRHAKALLVLDEKPDSKSISNVLKMLLKAAKLVTNWDNVKLPRKPSKLPQYAADNSRFSSVLDKQIQQLILQRKLLLEQEAETRVDPLRKLPQEIIDLVFENLSFDDVLSCLQVSQFWRDTLYEHPRIFRSLLLVQPKREDVKTYSEFVTMHLPRIKGLKLERLAIEVPLLSSFRKLLSILSTYTAKTAMVNFSHFNKEPTELATVFVRNMRNLEVNFLEPVSVDLLSIANPCHIIDRCPQLETLTVRHSRIKYVVLQDMHLRWKQNLNLKSLRLVHKSITGVDGLGNCPVRYNMSTLIRQVPCLQTLEIRCFHSSVSYYPIKLTLDGASGLPLKELSIGHPCGPVHLAIKPHDLQKLRIQHVCFIEEDIESMLSTSGGSTLTNRLQQLHSLELVQCVGSQADLFIDQLFKLINPSTLRTLVIKECAYGFKTPTLWRFLARCSGLQHLDVSCGSFTNDMLLRLCDLDLSSLISVHINPNQGIRPTTVFEFQKRFSEQRGGASPPNIYHDKQYGDPDTTLTRHYC